MIWFPLNFFVFWVSNNAFCLKRLPQIAISNVSEIYLDKGAFFFFSLVLPACHEIDNIKIK